MNTPSPEVSRPQQPAAAAAGFPRQLSKLAWFGAVLLVIFSKPLVELARFAWSSELHSYILLIPLVSLYLVWSSRPQLALVPASEPWRGGAVSFLLAGLALVAAYWRFLPQLASAGDRLAILMLALVCLLYAGSFWFLGIQTLRAVAFPLGFLLFAVPLPDAVVNGMEQALRYGSAEVAYWMLRLTAMPMLRQGTIFRLPGITLQVAPECSGIHSSLVLFIVSCVAARLLLRSWWGRALFVLATIPLGLLRNGFRIFTLAQLCVNVDPAWIHSELHHRGGPIFFAASLIPLFLLLAWLRRREQAVRPSA